MNRKLLLFGAGMYGRSTLEILRQVDEIEVVGFVDNDKDKQGKTEQGLPVFSTEAAVIMDGCDILITVYRKNSIIEQLNSLNCKRFYVEQSDFLKTLNQSQIKQIHQFMNRDEGMDVSRQIGEFWSKQSLLSDTGPSPGWWNCPRVSAHYQRMIAEGFGIPYNTHVLQTLGRNFQKAVSVGCGHATDEINLIITGVVDHFTLYEYSNYRIEAGQKYADAHGVSDKVTFKQADFYTDIPTESYDLVFWKNALHHMFDSYKAVEWSYNALKGGGVIYLEDYVGPSRGDYSEDSAQFIRRVRDILPQSVRTRCFERFPRIEPEYMGSRNIFDMYSEDPSEMADSGNIMKNFEHFFSPTKIVPLGGLIYNTLGPLMVSIEMEDEKERSLMDTLLLLDETAVYRKDLDPVYIAAYAYKD